MDNQLFKFNDQANRLVVNGKEVTVIGTYDEPWFAGKELCEALGYKDPKCALQDNIKEKHKRSLAEFKYNSSSNTIKLGGRSPPNLNGLSNTIDELTYHDGKAVYISEQGAYTLAMRCKLPIGDAFREWLSDIVATIRRTGQFKMQKQIDAEKETLRQQLMIKEHSEEQLQREKQELADRLKAEQEYSQILKDMVAKEDPIPKTQVVYISTSSTYARQNLFKVGGLDSQAQIKPRLASYNTNRTTGDEWYFLDIFIVADYRVIEAQLKILVGRFRPKKNKEMYKLHYTHLRYIVDYLCRRSDEDVDLVNEKLTEFIQGLCTYNLRPVVPSPLELKLANVMITELKKDGTVHEHVSAKNSPEFVKKVEEFVHTLDANTKSISRREVFDALEVKKDRKELMDTLQSVFNKMRPDVTLRSRN